MSYLTAARDASHDEVINGSTFIAYVASVDSLEAAHALLQRARDEHPDASHHCWAYKIADVLRFSDDGEPGGSAGRPMLEVILKRELDHCAAVVVRYFGGKKLGVGGLVRAYSGSVARALDSAGVREVVPTQQLEVRAPFAATDTVLRAIGALTSAAQTSFDERGLVVTLEIPDSDVETLSEQLAELTSGAVTVKELATK